MAFTQATPSHALPGAFLHTPAVASRFNAAAQQDPVRRRLFREPSITSSNQLTRQSSISGRSGSVSQSGNEVFGTPSAETPNPMNAVSQSTLPQSPTAKAALYVNNALERDRSYPELDTYCRQHSSEYEVASTDSAWAPFHKTTMYPIPDAVFAQYNNAQVSTMMGLFAELNHAWVAIDNNLYLWDYTHPNPQLIGYEENQYSITAVKLVPPKPGVFLPKINYILVVATTADMFLLGVSASSTPSGAQSVELYGTRMTLPLRGIEACEISATSGGRIFFTGRFDSDVHELFYQQEEKWFSSRTSKINHSSPGWAAVVPNPSQMIWGKATNERIVSIVVDNSRNLLYTLSSISTVRTYFIEGPDKLTKVIEKTKNDFLRDIAHALSVVSPLLTERMNIVSISPISAVEDAKVHLMALTDSGCRLFMSATSASSYMMSSSTSAPQSMQLQSIKFPPPENPQQRSTRTDPFGYNEPVDVRSRALEISSKGIRFAPGYFLDFVVTPQKPGEHAVFASAPDSGRIKNTSRTQGLRYYEHANWIDVGSTVEDVGLISKPFAASGRPLGFGNELAVQFDEPHSSEFAILTNTGVHVIRRRRLVEIFATAIRAAAGEEGLKAEVNRFQTSYGRVETITSALAVACRQGGSNRGAVDQATVDRAKQVFTVFGGNPTLPEQDGQVATIDMVRPSSRHSALSLYLSRLVRSLWNSRVIAIGANATGALVIDSAVPISKLKATQESVEGLRKFLDDNRAFIQGLSGPADLQRAANKQEELAFQGEHQAMHALEVLMTGITEGISFVTTLFDERVVDIFTRLGEDAQQQLKDLTYERLFSQSSGKDLAKVLVKAIVNRNIENGSNVETVADALRRKCGSFCSPDDVVIFKAQEQLKRASEPTINPNTSRTLLHESLKLFQKVASSLTQANLESAVSQYINLRYYAGAIQLCLTVANEKDRGNTALSWVNDGKPSNDSRAKAFDDRKSCYNLIHHVLQDLDVASSREPESVDGKPTLLGTKRAEAYDVVNDSTDEVFHFDLYDWYLEQGWTDRLLSIESQHVTTFLRRLAAQSVEHADLLCRFYTMRGLFYEAAKVQFQIANSEFELSIKDRLMLLSRAKTNASVMTADVGRQEQQYLNHQVSELLEVAHIQDDLLERLRIDPRLTERRNDIVAELNGPIRDLSSLYNDYADQASYYDLCLIIFHAADFRNAATIAQTWTALIANTHEEVQEQWAEYEARRPGHQGSGDDAPPQPYEALVNKIQDVCHRSSNDSFIFPVPTLLPEVCAYAYEGGQDQRIGADVNWPIVLFLNLGVSYDLVVRVLEQMFEAQEVPFRGAARSRLIEWICFAIGRWMNELSRAGRADARLDPWVGELVGECEQWMATAQGNNEGGMNIRDLQMQVRQTKRALQGFIEGLSLGGMRQSRGFY
ncbi:Non-repetitive/WGA-negative nucleoporin C-terminal-domain-containing protein [Microdochium trichocladiopsis]|uniref:Non-repetitive/WGA-negative nucleoporin C-terminal-domain-containing protein n=1 Tax=Microdochium trichocladiopsis TaxID=1682393 RepID=A0A9P9BUP9_9PEZI|nr:Non-repetitive/WGA-negative nucleoporin C-terminal-domain-containing protein [Microdochium trichocladiopsis]KAH7031669.1 Non-repetitive/WGA-negative nucleoporin C-terminal-domain-containing protein [Microdochium trichocladiopsis]